MQAEDFKPLKIAAIIAEYNPFTKGHAYHIQQTRQICNPDCIVCILSGNFVQRGGPAIFHKQLRTSMALAGGADVVFELPTGFATQSAEIFAHGGVALAQEMGADFLSFGTEAPVALLNRVTDALAEESDEFQHVLKQNLEKKRSFAQSRTEALNTVLSLTPEEQALIYSPNAILAIEYLLKLKTFKSTIKPITISRKGSHYSDSSDKVEFPSATAVRRLIYQQDEKKLSDILPKEVYELLHHHLNHRANAEQFYPLIKYAAQMNSAQEISHICGVFPGMEFRISDSVFDACLSQMIERIHSKHTTRTAVNRMLFSLLLHITKENVQNWKSSSESLYLRLLGFRKSAASAVAYIQKTAHIPVITNVPSYRSQLQDTSLFELDLLASDIYQTATGLPDCAGRPDFVLHPVIFNDC